MVHLVWHKNNLPCDSFMLGDHKIWFKYSPFVSLVAFLSEPPLTGGAISQIDFCTFFYQWFWSGWEVLPSDNQEQEKCDGTTERLGFTAAGFVGVLEILWTLRTFDFLYWVLLIATCFTAACSIFWDVVILWTLQACNLLNCLHHSACCGHFAGTEYHWNSK